MTDRVPPTHIPAELEQALAALLTEHDPTRRQALIDRAKAGFPLHQEFVERWLYQHSIAAPTRNDGADSVPVGDPSRADGVQSTATAELLQKLAQSPELDSNRYHLEGEIDRGGIGVILRIHDRHLNRRLAMKVLQERAAPRSAAEQKFAHQTLGRFLEEAQVTSQLDHPGVVPVHELGLDHGGKVYFTMRLVKGRTAGEVFRQARTAQDGWTVTRALEVVLKICDTMAFAHDKGVLHRDLKPANVMVGRFGEVYVMDWGLAKVVGQDDKHDLRIRTADLEPESRIDTARRRDAAGEGEASVVTLDNQALGTPCYMSPEQAKSEVLDQRADVYAIGAMLYELLTGRAPYTVPGSRQDWRHVLAQVVEGPPARIEDLAKDVPAELVAIAEKAMARDRELRYASALELAADLRAFLDQRSVKAYRTGALVELKLWVRRNKSLAASLAAALLILVAAVVVTSTLAKQNAVLAKEKGDLAESETQAKLAEAAKVREFDQLAGVVWYERAVANENELYPPWPHKIEAMETWLREDAGKLLAKRQEIEDTVNDLRKGALPRTAAEIEADRRSHSRFAEFELRTKRVAALRQAQAIRAGTAQLIVQELPAEQQALDMLALNTLAWERVAPEGGKVEQRKVYCEESIGLAAARLAAQKAKGTPSECLVQSVLAWALVANGQDAAAKQASQEARNLAPEEQRATYEALLHFVQAACMQAAEALATAEQQLAELTQVVSERRTFQFKLESQRFLHDTLVALLGKFASLEQKEKAAVEQRLFWANRIQQVSLAHPNARHTWAAVRTAIAQNPNYAGRSIDLRDQDITGLVPIGENPVTHLWEFYDLRSAWDGKGEPKDIAIPAHELDGSIDVAGDTGIVFVLLPGGTFLMGSQKQDEAGPNYDPEAEKNESPPHEVTLTPFFLARHELTQGQWARLWSGASELRQPSYYAAGTTIIGKQVTWANPATNVNWSDCDVALSRHGLVLPTEAQWEFGCRAGTMSPWACSFDQLKDYGNLADSTAKPYVKWFCESWADGHAVHAPVGSFAANLFGLYDMYGNVWEWCRDEYGPYSVTAKESDGLGRGDGALTRCQRGGGFDSAAIAARSANRSDASRSTTAASAGLRAARKITR